MWWVYILAIVLIVIGMGGIVYYWYYGSPSSAGVVDTQTDPAFTSTHNQTFTLVGLATVLTMGYRLANYDEAKAWNDAYGANICDFRWFDNGKPGSPIPAVAGIGNSQTTDPGCPHAFTVHPIDLTKPQATYAALVVKM
jgi:hypothetical protein